jgi:hypothetical protein
MFQLRSKRLTIGLFCLGLTGCGMSMMTRDHLPSTYNDVMVSLVNEAANPIWIAAWKSPRSEFEWRDLGRRASQLKLAGALLSLPGEGPMDSQWSADPRWDGWADKLQQSAIAAADAVESRSLPAIQEAGDRIVEVCEGCHKDFKPATPTGGKYGELSPSPSDFDL